MNFVWKIACFAVFFANFDHLTWDYAILLCVSTEWLQINDGICKKMLQIWKVVRSKLGVFMLWKRPNFSYFPVLVRIFEIQQSTDFTINFQQHV